MSAISVEDHTTHVCELLQPLGNRPAEPVAVADALGRVAHADIVSQVDLPLFRNSQMDGFAVRASDVDTVPTSLRVIGTVAAGEAHKQSLEPGTALKIMTGAPVPEGADAIVPVENTTSASNDVIIDVSCEAGDYIRHQGSDVQRGMVLVRAGQCLEPRHIAVLAAVGLSHVDVIPRPRVAVITTGAELADAGTDLQPGQIYDSNGITLAALLRANGADVVAVLRSSDDPDVFRGVLASTVSAADLVVTSGGVSKGDFEVVKGVLQPMGGTFGSVRMQPGGPQGTAFIDGVPVLNFPGNPVSTVVSFVVFARDIVRSAAGLPPVPTRSVPLKNSINSIAGKRQFLRGSVQDGHVSLVAGPGSHLVAAMAWADVLVDVPADVTALDAGTEVSVVTL
ncbi:molybdopterin molybdotransferase MoeA [Rhodococcus qingshengii]